MQNEADGIVNANFEIRNEPAPVMQRPALRRSGVIGAAASLAIVPHPARPQLLAPATPRARNPSRRIGLAESAADLLGQVVKHL